MKVSNNASQEIEVSINHWGDSGDTSYFSIAPGSDETWDRSDERGFVMVVKKIAARLPYYIQRNSDISVSDTKVTDKGTTINPIS